MDFIKEKPEEVGTTVSLDSSFQFTCQHCGNLCCGEATLKDLTFSPYTLAYYRKKRGMHQLKKLFEAGNLTVHTILVKPNVKSLYCPFLEIAVTSDYLSTAQESLDPIEQEIANNMLAIVETERITVYRESNLMVMSAEEFFRDLLIHHSYSSSDSTDTSATSSGLPPGIGSLDLRKEDEMKEAVDLLLKHVMDNIDEQAINEQADRYTAQIQEFLASVPEQAGISFQCSVYAARPSQCALFPLGRFYPSDLKINEMISAHQSEIEENKGIDESLKWKLAQAFHETCSYDECQYVLQQEGCPPSAWQGETMTVEQYVKQQGLDFMDRNYWYNPLIGYFLRYQDGFQRLGKLDRVVNWLFNVCYIKPTYHADQTQFYEEFYKQLGFHFNAVIDL